MIRLFHRFGFIRERVLRDIWPLEGLCGDTALFAMTRTDFESRFPAST
jgi:hypothetical protein